MKCYGLECRFGVLCLSVQDTSIEEVAVLLRWHVGLVLEHVIGEGTSAIGVRVATVFVLVHTDGVATLASDGIAGLASHKIGHGGLDEVIDPHDGRTICAIVTLGIGQLEGMEETLSAIVLATSKL